MKSFFFIVLVFWFSLLSSGFSVYAGADNHKKTHEKDSSEIPPHLLDEGDEAPLFTLTNQDRKKIALSDFSGRPRFVVFIYTHCEDVCPLILQDRKRLEEDMAQTIGSEIVFLAVTFDPINDTPEVLKTFIEKIGVDTKDLHLLTGDLQEVEAVLRAYAIGVIRDKATGQIEGHSALGFAIDRNGIVREVFNFSS